MIPNSFLDKKLLVSQIHSLKDTYSFKIDLVFFKSKTLILFYLYFNHQIFKSTESCLILWRIILCRLFVYYFKKAYFTDFSYATLNSNYSYWILYYKCRRINEVTTQVHLLQAEKSSPSQEIETWLTIAVNIGINSFI